jgi:NAD(P)-dependent dehydrogenase (short-subunit alcohol dehydrogenase family)
VAHTKTKEIFTQGSNAVITGGASGIGLATGEMLVRSGLNVLLLDLDADALASARETLLEKAGDGAQVLTQSCDVSDFSALEQAATLAADKLGDITVLMNNAGVIMDTGKPWENAEKWRQLLDINMGGVINSTQAFVPAMLEHGKPSRVINTGSKQGITRPPGNPAYNLSKAGVISFTESLAYEFRQLEESQISAHLLVPGFTYTGMMSKWLPEKPPGAWTSKQVVDFMLERLKEEDFYILCPDNDVTREMDQKRIQWYADDLIKNRPALSRWHPDFEDAFAAFMAE